MTGETHRAGGAVAGVVGFMLLKNSGLLLPNVNEGLQLLVMYPFAMWGSVASDLDHHWASCPSKDAPSWLINKVLHLTSGIRGSVENSAIIRKSLPYQVAGVFDASHRSWQTHSDFTLATIIVLLYNVLLGHMSGLSVIDIEIAALILVGIGIGVIAHLILDMLTPEGIWLTLGVIGNKLISLAFKRRVTLLPEKLRLVPHTEFFATGGSWESLINWILRILTAISAVYIVVAILFGGWSEVLNLLPYRITFG